MKEKILKNEKQEQKNTKDTGPNLKTFLSANPEILIKMIEDITGLESSILKNNIEIKSAIEKGQTSSDFIIEFDKENNIIISISKKSFARTLLSNVTHLLMGLDFPKENPKKELKLVQIHINNEPNCKKAISKYRIKDYPEPYQTIVCIEINPSLCQKALQNNQEVEPAIKWGAFLGSKAEESNSILSEILKEKEN